MVRLKPWATHLPSTDKEEVQVEQKSQRIYVVNFVPNALLKTAKGGHFYEADNGHRTQAFIVLRPDKTSSAEVPWRYEKK